jgi:protein CpxP
MAMRILHRLGDYLALTDEQRTQIEGIVETARGQIQPLIEQSMAARRAFHEATQPGAFDEAGFRAHAEEMAKLQVEIKVASARAMAQVFNVLTPEQRQKLDELKGLARPMDGEGFGFRHGGGPGAGPGGV